MYESVQENGWFVLHAMDLSLHLSLSTCKNRFLYCVMIRYILITSLVHSYFLQATEAPHAVTAAVVQDADAEMPPPGDADAAEETAFRCASAGERGDVRIVRRGVR